MPALRTKEALCFGTLALGVTGDEKLFLILGAFGILFAVQLICLRMGFYMKRALKSAADELPRLSGPRTAETGLNSRLARSTDVKSGRDFAFERVINGQTD